MAGELIGVVNSKYIDETIEGISFAIPGDTTQDVLIQIMSHGYVKNRPDLGLGLNEMSRTMFGTVIESFVIVTDTRGNEDIKLNDLIYAVDGKEVSKVNEIKALVQKKQIGEKVKLTIKRNRSLIEVEVEIVEYVPISGSVEFIPNA